MTCDFSLHKYNDISHNYVYLNIFINNMNIRLRGNKIYNTQDNYCI